MSLKSQRLDLLLVEKGLARSRQRARALIMAGKVLVDALPVDKAGMQVRTDAQIRLKQSDIPYVSRGGLKLQAALEGFRVDVTGWICMDVGASTGGFTDCLLQHGAHKVYAVDVGYGQLAWSLRQDPRVVAIERTNIRHMPLERIPQLVDLATVDVSFISLKIVLPALFKFLRSTAQIIALVKPQFEVGKGKVGKGGVVRDPLLQQAVIDNLRHSQASRVTCTGVLPSPILGPKGNREFLMHLAYIAAKAPEGFKA